jgi:hypothetical protein
MTKITDTVMIKDGSRERYVKVTIDAPNPEELDPQYLAQKAWLTRAKKLKRGNVTVTVERTRR